MSLKEVVVKYYGGIENSKQGTNLTGSMTLLSVKTISNKLYEILIDAGSFQGCDKEGLNNELFDLTKDRISNIHSIIITHAHMDHIGRLPFLVKNGFSGNIFMTGISEKLCKLMWEDLLSIWKQEDEILSNKKALLHKSMEIVFTVESECGTEKKLADLEITNKNKYKKYIESLLVLEKNGIPNLFKLVSDQNEVLEKLNSKRFEVYKAIKGLLNKIKNFQKKWKISNKKDIDKPTYCTNEDYDRYLDRQLQLQENSGLLKEIDQQLSDYSIKSNFDLRKVLIGKIENLFNNTRLYDETDVRKTLLLIEKTRNNVSKSIGQSPEDSLDNGVEICIDDTGFIKLEFIKAAHVEGSIQALFKILQDNNNGQSKYFNMLFTGDLGRVSEGRTPGKVKIPSKKVTIDYIQMESTYAYKPHHPNRYETQEILVDSINSCKGNVLIASFSLQRFQEILKILTMFLSSTTNGNSKNSHLELNVDEIFCDSKLSYNISQLFLSQIPNKYGFLTNQLINRIDSTKQRQELKDRISKSDEKTLLVSSSGMLQGGPIVDNYLPMILSDPDSRLILSGFQAHNTRGNLLREWRKGRAHTEFNIEGNIVSEKISLFGKDYSISYREGEKESKIVQLTGLSSHPDQSEIIEYLSKVKLRKSSFIALTHGGKPRNELAVKILSERKIYGNVFIPESILESVKVFG